MLERLRSSRRNGVYSWLLRKSVVQSIGQRLHYMRDDATLILPSYWLAPRLWNKRNGRYIGRRIYINSGSVNLKSLQPVQPKISVGPDREAISLIPSIESEISLPGDLLTAVDGKPFHLLP